MFNIDNLRLEVEVPSDGLTNLVQNPSGDDGAWGWVTPISNTIMTIESNTDGPYLRFKTTVSQAAYFTTDFMPTAAGKYVSARFDTIFATTSHNVKTRYEWYDSSRTLLSSSTQSTAFDATVKTNFTPTIQAPANTAYFKLRFDFYNGTANPSANTFYGLRKVMAISQDTGSVATVRTNLLSNPSFETNTNGWTNDVALATSTTFAYVGTHSLKITNNFGFAADIKSNLRLPNSGPTLSVTGGATYTLQFQIRSGGTARKLYAIASFAKSDGSFAGSVTGPTVTENSGAWLLYTFTFTAPTAATKLGFIVQIVGMGNNESHYVDAVMLEKDSSAGSYFDGSFASTSSMLYAWTGTANASTSTATTAANTFDYAAPQSWQNILGPTSNIDISRSALNVGTLTAMVRDALLDPAVADTIRPGKKVRLRSFVNGAWDSVYEGVTATAITNYDRTKSAGSTVKTNITLTASDNIASLANQGESRVVATIAELPELMEGKGVPWNINGSGDQVSSANVVATNDNASTVDAIAVARDSTLGYAWVDRHNVLVAWDSSLISTTSKATFSDVSGLSYTDIAVDFSTDTCINSVTINFMRYNIGTEGTELISYGPYEDAASIAQWGVRSADFTIAAGTEDEASIKAYAQSILDANSTPFIKCHTLTMPVRSDSEMTYGTTLDLYDLVHVTYADKVDADHRITSINHSITANPTGAKWLITYGFDGVDSVAQPTWVPAPSSPASSSLHIVGSTGEPSFANSWHNNSSSDAPVGFFKDRDGLVHIQGVVSGGTIGASTYVFILPAGYIPSGTVNLPATGNGGAAAQVRITSDGKVAIPFGPTQWVSLVVPTFAAAST